MGERCDPGPGLTIGGPLVGAGTAAVTETATVAVTKCCVIQGVLSSGTGCVSGRAGGHIFCCEVIASASPF